MAEPNISDWRRRTFGDLTSAFRLDDQKAKPPTQEPGQRPRVPRTH